MSEAQSQTAKKRYYREAVVICERCNGKGTVLSKSVTTRARQGGLASVRKSLEPGQLTMKQRGELGGQPRARRL